jgi:hypothetical protein
MFWGTRVPVLGIRISFAQGRCKPRMNFNSHEVRAIYKVSKRIPSLGYTI